MMIARHRLGLLALVALFAFVSFAGATTTTVASDAAWWDAKWPRRYRIVFEHLSADSVAEVAVVTFHAPLESRSDPFDMRATDGAGTSCPLKVLYWTASGETTCLVALDDDNKAARSRIWIYAGNPDALPDFSMRSWRDPLVLVGTRVDSRYARHGKWRWRDSPRFGAVHIGDETAFPPRRVTHGVTGFRRITCNPVLTRVTQMAWIDPNDPPRAIGLHLDLDKDPASVWWTDDDAPPVDNVGGARSIGIGPLPDAGEWRMLVVEGEDLELVRSNNLTGVWFSNVGGSVRWGPTSVGAMPTFGKAVACERLLSDDDGTTRVIVVDDDPRPPTVQLTSKSLCLSVVRAPLFADERKPLRLAWLLTRAEDLPSAPAGCELEIVAMDDDGTTRVVRTLPAPFTGGDNRLLDVVDIPADLAPNGEMLSLDGDPACFVLRSNVEPFADSRRTTSTTTLVLTPALTPLEGGERVSINSDDVRLGLGERVGTFTRRSAAEWTVAAASATRSGDFARVRIAADPDLADIGVAIPDVGSFLRGVVALLQSGGVEVMVDLSGFNVEEMTARARAILAASMEMQLTLTTPPNEFGGGTREELGTRNSELGTRE